MGNKARKTVVFKESQISIFKCDFVKVPHKITLYGLDALVVNIAEAAKNLKPNGSIVIDAPEEFEYEWDIIESADEFTGPNIKVTRYGDSNEKIFVQIVWETKGGDECWVEGDVSKFTKLPLDFPKECYGGKEGANRFMTELLDYCETLTGIADEHGARTLADLMYLQNAILNDTFIDNYPGESKVMQIAKALPSGKKWVKFIKTEYMEAA